MPRLYPGRARRDGGVGVTYLSQLENGKETAEARQLKVLEIAIDYGTSLSLRWRPSHQTCSAYIMRGKAPGHQCLLFTK